MGNRNDRVRTANRRGTMARLAMGVIAGLSLCWRGAGAADGAALSLPVVMPEPVEAVTVRLTGVVRAREEVPLAFEVAGRLVEKTVAVGARVSQGQVVARLDAAELRAARDAARAQAEQAKAQAQLAASERRRLEGLAAQGFAPAQQLDRAREGERAAEAALRAAQATLQRAEVALARAELRAGQAGVLTQWLVEPGQVVAAGQPVARLAVGSVREVEVALPPTLAAKPPERGEVVDGAGHRFVAQWRESDALIDVATRSVRARYPLQRAEALPLGATVEVHLPLAVAGAWRVPIAALDERGAGARLWRLQGEAAEAVPVEVLTLEARHAVVAGPLAANDRLIAAGVHQLYPGRRVVAR